MNGTAKVVSEREYGRPEGPGPVLSYRMPWVLKKKGSEVCNEAYDKQVVPALRELRKMSDVSMRSTDGDICLQHAWK